MKDSIFKALVAAQRNFGKAIKSSANPHFRSKYADLSSVFDAVLGSFNDHGIMVTQITHECSDGVIVETQFLHESGEVFSAGRLHVPTSKHDAQGYGSALTYARRYSLMAACGIAGEDDDGNAAVAATPKKIDLPKKSKIDPSKIAALFKEATDLGWTPEEMKKLLEEKIGVKGTSELSEDQFSQFRNLLINEDAR